MSIVIILDRNTSCSDMTDTMNSSIGTKKTWERNGYR